MNVYDMTVVNKKNYQLYRVMKAPGAWGEFYRKRINQLHNHPGAIIFPETLLGLNQTTIYAINASIVWPSTPEFKVGFKTVSNFTLRTRSGDLRSLEDILEYETSNPVLTVEEAYSLSFPNIGSDVNFTNRSSVNFMTGSALFTSKRHAVRYCNKLFEHYVNNL